MNEIEYFLNKYKLTNSEKEFYNYCCCRNKKYKKTEKPFETVSLLFSKMIPYQFQGIEDYSVSFDESATDLINEVFIDNVTDGTLIISSNSEHPNINFILDEFKKQNEVCKIISYNHIDISDELISKIQKAKNVFVYCIGTTCSSGYQIPNVIFKKIKDLCETYNKECIIALDSIQELFLSPRDYSIFDYIFGTGHVYAPDFNMGFCLSKKPHFNYYYDNIMDLHELIKIYLNRSELIRTFSDLIKNHFEYLVGSEYQLQSGASYLVSIGDSNGKLKAFMKETEKRSSNDMFNISFRCSDCLYKPEETLKRIKKLDKFFKIKGY